MARAHIGYYVLSDVMIKSVVEPNMHNRCLEEKNLITIEVDIRDLQSIRECQWTKKGEILSHTRRPRVHLVLYAPPI